MDEGDKQGSPLPSGKPKGRTRWQFGLRTMLVVTAIVAGFFAWYGSPGERQSRIAAKVRAAGGSVGYGHAENSVPRNWFQKLLAREHADPITSITFANQTLSDADVAAIGTATTIRRIDLLSVKMSPGAMEGLAGLKSLDTLKLGGSAVNDEMLKHVGDLTSLKSLDLSGAKATVDGLAHLEKLPHLEDLKLDIPAPDDAVFELLAKLPLRSLSWEQAWPASPYNAVDNPGHSAASLRRWYESTRHDANRDRLNRLPDL